MAEPVERGWLPPDAFPFLRTLESAAAAIRAELDELLARRVWSIWGTERHTPTFTRMTSGEVERTLARTRTRIGDGALPSWKLFGLYLHGERIEDGCRLCPGTAEILRGIPGLMNAGFSCLEAGYVIAPHVGYDRRIYRAHLGLVVPPGDCALEVNGVAKRWTFGKALIFDDTCPHTAWNRTGECRITLGVDVTRDAYPLS